MRHSRLIAALAALLAAATLFACSGDEQPPADTTAEVTEAATTAPEPAKVELITAGTTPFSIVRADADEGEATLALLKSIHTAFADAGVTAQLGTDWKKKDAEPNAESYEILVGATNHPESAEALVGVKYRDFAVKLIGNKIVLAGHTSATRAKAVNHFIQFIKDNAKAGETLVFSESDNYVSESEYMVDTATLGGVSLEDCVMVLSPDAEYAAENFARALRDTIATRTGFYLPIVETADGAKASIAVVQDGTTAYSAAVSGTTMTCTAGSMFGFDHLYERLNSVIREAKDTLTLDVFSEAGDLTNVKDETITRALTVDGDIRVLYHNIWGSEMYNRDDMQVEVYLQYMPDVIGLQEVNVDRVRNAKPESIFKMLKDTYTEVPVTATNPSKNSYVPILYRADKLELVDSGWHLYADGAGDQSKSVAWAVFRDKATGKSFGMANTHFYWTSDALGVAARKIDAAEIIDVVAKAQQKHNVPFIIGGDLNCRMSAEPQIMLRKADWKNAWQSATVYHSNSNGHHSYPTLDESTGIYSGAPLPTGDYSAAIDHIYMAGDGAEIRVFETILHTFAIDSSDHCPIFVDVKLN